MAISINTNVNALIAQENLRVNSDFQGRTIQRLTSGYRINSSGDDAAGLAVANKFRSDTAELMQGVRNANDGLSQLQIIDGGLNNISKMLDRLKTLATQSASVTFTGKRETLNNEYQALLKEIDRQAANIGLDSNGTFNKVIDVYTGGGGETQANSKVSVDLSGDSNVVTYDKLGLSGTNIAAGGVSLTGNNVRLDNVAGTFSGDATLTFHMYRNNQNSTVAITYTHDAASGQEAVVKLNEQLSDYGIAASIGGDGKLRLNSGVAFSVSVAAAANSIATDAVSADANTSLNSVMAEADFVGMSATESETALVTTQKGTYTLALDDTNAATIGAAVSYINQQLGGSGVYAITNAAGTRISLQSAEEFSASVVANVGAGVAFKAGTTTGAVAYTAASSGDGSAAEAAIKKITAAVEQLGTVQGRVGTGQNKLQYAITLAQSQISGFSAAESRIRDADVAEEAANLTKAQVMQQASIAAMAQANAAPQAVLSLLRG